VVGNNMVRAGCWAHARRKFVDAEAAHPAIAAEAAKIIAELYAVEERGKGLDHAARGELRRAESAPLLGEFKAKLHAWRDGLLPKHPMALAIAYALNQWETLVAFAADGAVPIDNNTSEREMKRIVLSPRRPRTASSWATNAPAAPRPPSPASRARAAATAWTRNATSPQLLVNLPTTPVSRLEQWLPDQWKRRDTPPPA